MKLYLAHIPSLLPEPGPVYLPLLTPLRAAQAAQIRVEAAQKRCICAGLLLRMVFGAEEPACGPQGKPYFPGRPAFSLSHSGEFAVLAVGGNSVGADLEQLRTMDPRLVKRFFHPAEAAYLPSSKDPDWDFTRIWTWKESFVKALGTGLSLRPSSFCLPEPRKALIYARSKWYFREYTLPGYALTLCDRDAPPEAALVYPQASELLQSLPATRQNA